MILKPNPKSIIYKDQKLYACLARDSVAKGHTMVIFKKEVPDLRLLPDRDYDYLMDTVFAVRNALIKTLKVKKVYLLYMDETKHVHWHLIPRYEKQGFYALQGKAKTIKDFSLSKKIKKNLTFE